MGLRAIHCFGCFTGVLQNGLFNFRTLRTRLYLSCSELVPQFCDHTTANFSTGKDSTPLKITTLNSSSMLKQARRFLMIGPRQVAPIGGPLPIISLLQLPGRVTLRLAPRLDQAQQFTLPKLQRKTRGVFCKCWVWKISGGDSLSLLL
jgi:hypothetical protein